MKRVGKFILVLGLFALALAVYAFVREQDFLSGAEVVTGKVTDHSISPGTDGSPDTYCPIVEFTASNGMKVTYEMDLCTSPPSKEIGESVEMYYNAETNSTQAKGFAAQYLGIIVLSCLGLPLTLGGFGAVLRRGK